MKQKLQFFHNAFSKNTLRFHLDLVQSYAITFQQAAEIIEREYKLPF